MLNFLSNLDRRWIFLAMAIAVGVPILFQVTFPEKATRIVQDVFDKVDNLPEGSKVLIACDYDPASAGELDPMATALVWHCARKKHKIYFMALWPLGPRMIQHKIKTIIKADFPDMKYGEDYVNLGFKSGGEGVIIVIASDLRKLFPADENGTSLDDIPMTKNIKDIRQMDMILSISAGTPGTKEWVQYVASPYKIPTAGGCTGVQAPLLYPYYPDQLVGLLGAIKGAAEYEDAVTKAYPEYAEKPNHVEGLRRMAPQLVAHLLMVGLIILGNVIFFTQKQK